MQQWAFIESLSFLLLYKGRFLPKREPYVFSGCVVGGDGVMQIVIRPSYYNLPIAN